MVDRPREIALKIIYDINENGAYSNISLNKHLEGNELKDVDRAFITDLVYGTVKWKLTIDWIIEQFSNIKIKKLSPWILNILRLGVYQLIYTDRIPVSAACNESVNLSKKYGHAASSSYVNAVLRNIARKKECIAYPDKKREPDVFLSVKHSHPLWLVKQWLQRYGEEFTGSLLESNNQVPDFTIRVNTLKINRDELVEELAKEGIDASPGKYLEDALIIKNPSSISRLEAFRKGYFQVQDESSMLVSRILDPKPGELVMDVCSAPGGKATHAAQLMGNEGIVLARDVHKHKIDLIQDASKRLGIKNIKTEVFDATQEDEAYLEKADRVLVDAPCTGLGIIRRKPDIKWARNIKDKSEITRLQTKILYQASKYVKTGGVLVYSTCTIEPDENENMVQDFLSNNKEFKLNGIIPLLPEGFGKAAAAEGYIQLFPNIDSMDGFFIARLKKVK